jgi:hypothetical protein
MNTVHFCCDEPAMKNCRSQSERAAIYVYRHSYSEPLLLNHKYQQRRKVSESAPAMAYMRERAYMGGLGTTSKSRPALAGVVNRAPPPMTNINVYPGFIVVQTTTNFFFLQTSVAMARTPTLTNEQMEQHIELFHEEPCL